MNGEAGCLSQAASNDNERLRILGEFSDVIESMARTNLKVFSSELAEHGITVLQYHALRSIATHGSELDMSSIAAMTGLSASSITSIIDRLDQRGLVVREHDEEDRRRVVATITGEGTALMHRIEAHGLKHTERVLAGITNEELRDCVEVFKRVSGRMMELYDAEHHAEARHR